MKKKRFELYNKEFQLTTTASPMLVSATKNPDDETKEQFIAVHDRFISLSESVKDKMASPETASQVQNIGNSYRLDSIQISDIARAIRNYYFGELKIEDIPFYLAKEIPIDVTRAQAITQLVLTNIINDNSLEEANQANLDNVTLANALKSYPEVGEQLITTDKIKMLSFPDPVRPSVKNWLADYTSAFGQDTHSSIIRGNYLFHSGNAKKINSNDRQKLAYVLKSFDEKSLITVDKNARKIVFNLQATSELSSNNTQSQFRSLAPETQSSFNIDNAKAQPFALGQTPSRLSLENSSANKISFSSPQRLSYERTNETQEKPREIIPAITRPQISANTPVKKTFGKNVVNLKDI